MKLGEFKIKPGTKLRTEFGTPIMTLQLCPGMIKGGDAFGGLTSVPVVRLDNGQTLYEDISLEVTTAKED